MKAILISISSLFLALSALANEPLQGFALWGSLLGSNPVIEGPNCWNLAVVDMGITKFKRFTPQEEFRESLNTFCQPVKSSEIQEGDIGAITYDGDYELHAFLVLDQRRAITKDFGSSNPRQDISYRIESIQKTISPYIKSPRSPECLGALKDAELSPCGANLQFYRCDRMRIHSLNQTLKNEKPELARALEKSEELLEKYHWQQTSKEIFLLSLENLTRTLDLTNPAEFNQSQKKILRLRILGLSESILTISTSPSSSQLKEKLENWTQALVNR